MSRRPNRAAYWARAVAEARDWLRRNGSDLAGYIAKYGDTNDPNRYGDGGPAIYAADRAALDHAEQQLRGAR